jgi:hypothetical protein
MICIRWAGGTMIKQISSTHAAFERSKFHVGSTHQSRRGFYEILSLKYPYATIRYQDGTENMCNLAALQKIEANILGSVSVAG